MEDAIICEPNFAQKTNVCNVFDFGKRIRFTRFNMIQQKLVSVFSFTDRTLATFFSTDQHRRSLSLSEFRPNAP